MEKHWKAMWPILSTGGSCTLVSTVNGLGNWYQETYHDAQEGRNKFHVIDLDRPGVRADETSRFFVK